MPNQTQHSAVLEQMAKMSVADRNQAIMNATVSSAAQSILSGIDNEYVKLNVKNVEVVSNHDNNDKALQQQVRNQNGTWADELRADVELVDKATGHIVDHASVKVADVPKLTDRHTYIIGGNEYGFTTQARLRPGIYTKAQNNGEISAFFNVDKTVDFDRGFNNNFKITFEPEKKAFWLQYGQKNIPLITALRALGKSDGEIRKDLGDEIYQANSQRYDRAFDRDLNKFHQAVFGKMPDSRMSVDQISKAIKDRLYATKLDPETTAITMGRPYENVNGQAITDAVKKIVDIHKGVKPGDDRDALIFKSFIGPEDIVRESLVKNAKNIQSNIGYKLTKTREIKKSMSSQSMSPFVSGTLVVSKLSNPPSQINVMSARGDGSKVTIMGEGGIGSTNAISDEARQISNTDVGFIDPMHTPEGGNIGVVNHMTNGTVRVGHDLYAPFLDLHSGKHQMLRPIDVYKKTVAFPDEYTIDDKRHATPHGDKIKAVREGKMILVKPSEVDYVIPQARQMFDFSGGAIPFLSSIQPNRGLTASKMQEQALPLVNRKAPLFKVVDEHGTDIHAEYGQSIGIPKSPVEGDVVSVNPEYIKVRDSKGNIQHVGLYNNFSLNNESFLHNTPIVKPGDKVKAGQILAESNNTHEGRLALGSNLRVAYVPYRGYNYEDSAIISKSGAAKLVSEHIYDFKARRSSNGVYNREKYRAFYPEAGDRKQFDKLDAEGIIKPGTEVEHGDILIAHMEHKQPTADDLAMKRLDKQAYRDMADHGVKWESGHKGVVTSVEKKGRDVVVNVKTIEPLVVGDKISGLHGNKHIISAIVEDHEMPKVKGTNEHIELTMSPIGVSDRINASQILENAAGKLAMKTGKPYVIKQFDTADNARKLAEDMKAAGVSHTDILIDPVTNREMKTPVANGYSHIMKLEHKVDHKFSARYRDGHDSNEQAVTGGETGGKNLGRMEVAALLARGAYANLNEMYNIKGQRNDEFWRAIETGNTPPPPKSAFVWGKMEAMLRGAGVNAEKNGKTIGLAPLTDKNIENLSSGRLDNAVDTYRKKDLAPIKGGLFDPHKAGGMMGDKYTHFDLPEPILNPAMEEAAASVLGLSGSQLNDVIHGNKMVDEHGRIVDPGTPGATFGGPGLKRMLSKVDVDAAIKADTALASSTKDATKLNKLNRRVHFMKSLKEQGLKPEDYLISKVLVIPSKYRPMFSMGVDNTVIMSDVNYLYQQAAATAKSFTALHKSISDASGGHEDVVNATLASTGVRGALYDDVKAVTGFGDPTSFLNKQKGRKGFMSLIDGGDKQTKEGFFQDKVMSRRQDLVGRSTITLNPNLGPDEVGIPKQMATKIFQPMVMQKLREWGYSPIEAKRQIDDGTPVFEKARESVAKERLVIANRAPTLHRWNMTAFHPVLHDGKTIEMPAVVVANNFGGDFDGDCIQGSSKIVLSSTFFDIFRKTFRTDQKCLFGKLYIDTDDCESYIDTIINPMEISMPTIDKAVVSQDDVVLHINLEDFPRIESSKVVRANGNEEYDVPDGVSIFTIDNNTHRFVKIPVTKYSVHKNLASFHVELSDGNTLWLSEDESAIAIKTSDWSLERISPKHSSGRMMARVVKSDVAESISTWSFDNSSARGASVIAKDSFELNEETGWFFGAIVGDGWASVSEKKCNLNIASIHDSIGMEFSRIADSMLVEPIPCTVVASNHEFEGYECFSKKYTKSSAILARNIARLIGEGAINKRLPMFYSSSPKSFKVGLLSGLLDTDGEVQYVSKRNGRRQFILMYSTVSERLACDVMELCRMLGIKSSIGTYRRKKCVEYRVVISTLSAHGIDFKFRHPDKRASWSEFSSDGINTLSSVSIRQDLVPFSTTLSILCGTFVHYQRNVSEYNALHDAKKNGCVYISRESARRIIRLDNNSVLPSRWVEVVENDSVTWLYVKSIEANKKLVDMYDITAPGPYTFMVANGIIVQDTLQIHVPIGAKAMAEAKTMLPSASTMKIGYEKILNVPEKDIQAGAWIASKGVGGTDKTSMKFETEHDLESALKMGKIDDVDTVELHGIKATAGMHVINAVLPKDARDYSKVLDKKTLQKWLYQVADKHGDAMSVHMADKMKEVGNRAVTAHGFTLSVDDIVSAKESRSEILKELKGKKFATDDDYAHAYHEATGKLSSKMQSDLGEHTNLGIGMASGAAKGISNILAIKGMPGILEDAHKRPIPIPITESYSEGLSAGGYWAAAHGARSGNIQKSVSSWKPGAMTKDLINSIYMTKIDSDHHIDHVGIEYDVDDSKAIHNRYLAQDAKDKSGKTILAAGAALTSDAVGLLKKAGVPSVHVQSPLTDPTPGDSISSHSYGFDHKGRRPTIGADIGVMSAHTITEPSLNLAMKAFHTGGAYTGKNETAFDILDRTLKFTHVTNKAAVAPEDGTVRSIHKSGVGGYDVEINSKSGINRLYVHPNNRLHVKVGDTVTRGMSLDNGEVEAQDVLKTQGMKAAQRYLVKKIDDVDKNALDRRDIEVMVRGITNTTRVMKDPTGRYVPGDVAPLTAVEHWNRQGARPVPIDDSIGMKLVEPIHGYESGTEITSTVAHKLSKAGVSTVHAADQAIEHEPFLTPTGIMAKPGFMNDWLARLGHNRVRTAIQRGAAQGWTSDISGKTHPIPYLVAGGHQKDLA